MARSADTRQMIVETIERNPGLHFRELQRRTDTATGQLEYHLYQLEQDNRIVHRQDGKLKRYFSNESGTTFERTLLYHMRNRESAKVISVLLNRDRSLIDIAGRSLSKRESISKRIDQLERDEIVEVFRSDHGSVFRITDRDKILKILKKYRESFLDSMAANLLSLLE